MQKTVRITSRNNWEHLNVSFDENLKWFEVEKLLRSFDDIGIFEETQIL